MHVETELAHVYARLGRHGEARKLLDQRVAIDDSMLRAGNDTYEPRYDLARVHAVRGNMDLALDWLDSAVVAGWRLVYTYLGPNDPLLEGVATHPRFIAMMERVRVSVDSMRTISEHNPRKVSEILEWAVREFDPAVPTR